MKKSFSFVALSVLLVAGLASCGETSVVSTSTSTATSAPVTTTSAPATSTTSAAPTVTDLTMWISQADNQATSDLVAAFNAKYPETPVSVTATEMAEGDVGSKYTSDPDNVPDISHVPGDVVTNLINNDYIASFSESDIETYLGTDIPTSTLKAGQDVNGNQYGLPFSLNTFFLYYDKSVYTDPATDLASVDSMVTKATAAGKKAFAVDITNGWYQQSLFMSDGDGIFADNGTSTTGTYLTGTAALNVAKLIASWYQEPSEFELGGSTDIQAAIGTDKNTAAFVSGSWDYNLASTGFGADNVGMTCLPDFSLGGADTTWLSVGDYKQIVVSNNSAHKKVAQKFALFMDSEAGQKIRWEDNGNSTVPTSAALNADKTFQAANKFAAVVGDVTGNGTFVQNTSANFNKYWDAAIAFGNAVKGNPTASDSDLQGYLQALNDAIVSA